jgi:hypothetical protein
MNMPEKRLLLSFTVLFGLLLQSGWGQSLTSLNGTVTDPTGAVIPGVQITLVNVDTQAQRQAKSDASGRYAIGQVIPGNYRIQASSAGFADVLISDVRLLVNTPATVPIVFEKLGAVAQTVAVSAEAAQVNTTDASLGNAFGTRPILELPFEARNVAQLLSLQPGVTFMGNTDSLANDPRNGAVAGGRSDQANVTLDGIDVNDQQNRYAFTSVLRTTLDSVQEFRVTTVNPTADQGRSSGAQVALITKSGTNDYHGSLYEYHRNTITSANTFFNNAIPADANNPKGGVERQKLLKNIFGASIGAPIVKNRLFYFLNYEGRRDAREDSITRAVPSETLRQGIVRYENTSGGVSSLTPDDLRRIDPAGIGVSQAALKVFQSYPLPNSDEVGEGLNIRGYRFKAPVGLRWNTYIAKFDTYVDKSSKHALFFRGNLQNDHSNSLPQFPGQPPASVSLINSKGFAIGYNAVLKPNLVSTARFGFTRQGVEGTGALDVSYIQLLRDLDTPFASTRGISRILPVKQYSEDMDWMKGAHNIKFGGVVRTIENRRFDYQNSYFYGVSNSAWLKGTGIELRRAVPDLAESFNNAYSEAALAALGVVTQVDSQYNYDIKGNPLAVGAPQTRNFAMEEYEMYVQDTWNVTRGLTLTAGLRWTLSPPVYEKQGYQTTAIPSLADWFNLRGSLAAQGKSQAEAGDLTFVRASDPTGRPMYPYHKKNFAPRLAIAYTPRASDGWKKWLFGGEGKTTIRAGAGILYDVYGQGIIRTFDSQQLGFTSKLQNPSGQLSLAQAPRFIDSYTFPQALITQPAPPGFPQLPPADGLQIASAIDDTLKPPFSLSLNFSIGREFRHGFFVEGSYVGRISRRILSSADLAIPTNLRDPKSGQTYWDAAKALAVQARKDVPVDQVKPVAFWENLFPDAAGDGLTATQRMYQEYVDIAPDYLTVLYDADVFCYPACATTGPYSMFQNQYSSLAAWRSIGRADYHAMQWSVRKRFSAGYQFDLNYSWSKSIDWGSGVERDDTYTLEGFIVNSWNPRQNKAVSEFDMRHQLNANAIVQLPFGKGRKWASGAGKALDAVIGGWQLAGVWRWTSGLPYYIYNGRAWPTQWNLAGYATPNGPLQTEMGVFKDAPAISGNPGPNIFKDPRKALESYDFTLPGEQGARNNIRGDGFFNIDGSLSKRWVMPYSEKHNLQLRWEVFNVTNSVRFDPASISNFLTISGSFGKYTDVLTQPRVMQFGLRYEF